MLKIQSLLNPSASSENAGTRVTAHSSAFSPPLTPALTSTTSNASYSPRMDTPDISSLAKRQKLIKDAPIFVKGEVQGKVHYAPFESNEETIALAPHHRDELTQQHRRFKIYPSGSEKDGLISDFVRRIPYSSEKKDFFGKMGLEGFDVFQYTFVVPDDPTKKEHTVMWDYNTGLVRITPFFKACKYSKTTPAKALNANPGLREMSHSVTGGALVAQGYWMPYFCARAICLTFAYPIRWALTPIFGPSFIRECLQPSHPAFARFKIDAETIRCAQMAMEGLRSGEQEQREREIPRSAPEEDYHYQQQQQQGQYARPPKPTFKLGSPFDLEAEVSNMDVPYGLAVSSALNSPAISPKTTAFSSSGWTSINRPSTLNNARSTPPSPPQNTLCSSLKSSLLTEQSHSSWRPAQTPAADTPTTTSAKRARRSSPDDNYSDSDSASDGSSESDDMDIDGYSKPELRGHGHAGRATEGYERTRCPYIAASRPATQTPPLKKSKKYTADDFRAARVLLELSAGGYLGGIKGEGKGGMW